MKNFKNKLQIFFKILICASFSTIQTNIIESKAQMIANISDATLGIESVGSPSLRVLKLKRTVYVGECPGVRNKPTSGYFVDYETPVQPGYAVVMQNFTRGLNPNKPPTVKKDYDAGRASDKIKFKLISYKKNMIILIMSILILKILKMRLLVIDITQVYYQKIVII